MNTETRAAREESGFTLIEVLVALVILSVGLLALEALGISAARSVASADRKSELTIGVTDVMESAIRSVRLSPTTPTAPNGCGPDAETGLYACTQVDTRANEPLLTPRTARITVTVRREADSDPSLTISSYVFHPDLPQ